MLFTDSFSQAWQYVKQRRHGLQPHGLGVRDTDNKLQKQNSIAAKTDNKG